MALSNPNTITTNKIKNNMNSMFGTQSTLVKQGIITAVRPEVMTVDVYVPSEGSNFTGLQIGGMGLGNTQKSTAIPEVGSRVILASTGNKSLPSIISAWSNSVTESQETSEKFYEGEIINRASSLASSKMNSCGDNAGFSGGANGELLRRDGLDYQSNSAENVNTAARKIKSGFTLNDVSLSNAANLYLRSKFNFFTKLASPSTVYAADDVTDAVTSSVLERTRELISLINGDDEHDSFAARVKKVEDIFSLSDATEINTVISEANSFLDESILSRLGSSVEIEFGAVSNDESNIPSTRVKNGSNDVIFSLKLKDSNGTVKGSIIIDEDANMVVRMKTYTVVEG